MDSSSWKRKRPALKERGSVWPHGRNCDRGRGSSDRGRGSRDRGGGEGVCELSKTEADIGPPRLEAHKNALSAHTHTYPVGHCLVAVCEKRRQRAKAKLLLTFPRNGISWILCACFCFASLRLTLNAAAAHAKLHTHTHTYIVAYTSHIHDFIE